MVATAIKPKTTSGAVPTTKLDAQSPSPPGTNGQLISYPESDGKPMADNPKQFRYIVAIHSGISALFANRDDVFVAGDLLWYPVEGNNKLRVAPDVLVAFDRPPGDRGSYLQWREGNISPHVVFEVLSPGNTISEMVRKFNFYRQYGVEEYYLYDPDRGELTGWMRQGDHLEEIPEMQDWVSPRLGIRFELAGVDLVLYRPDGTRFETYLEMQQRAEVERQRAEVECQRADAERQRADAERQRAEVERQRAEVERQRADTAAERAEVEYVRAERLATKLRELGIDSTTME